MRRNRAAAIRTHAASAILIATVGCTSATEVNSRLERVDIRISTDRASATMFSGPYVSIVDSVDLTVAPPNGPATQHMGRRLARRDNAASFPLLVERGQYNFTVQVLSPTGALLYNGNQPANVSADGFSVDVPLAPRGPILLVAPDTAKTSKTTTDQAGNVIPYTMVTVHNRGIDSLTWSVKDTLTPTSATVCASGCIRFNPFKGTLAGGDSTSIIMTHKQTFGTAITFVITAGTRGEVPVVVSPF